MSRRFSSARNHCFRPKLFNENSIQLSLQKGSLFLIAVYKNTLYTSVLNHLNDFKIE